MNLNVNLFERHSSHVGCEASPCQSYVDNSKKLLYYYLITIKPFKNLSKQEIIDEWESLLLDIGAFLSPIKKSDLVCEQHRSGKWHAHGYVAFEYSVKIMSYGFSTMSFDGLVKTTVKEISKLGHKIYGKPRCQSELSCYVEGTFDNSNWIKYMYKAYVNNN